jgi:hypothetical protein
MKLIPEQFGTTHRVLAMPMHPSLANVHRLLKTEGAGNAGRWPHPQPCVQKK